MILEKYYRLAQGYVDLRLNLNLYFYSILYDNLKIILTIPKVG